MPNKKTAKKPPVAAKSNATKSVAAKSAVKLGKAGAAPSKTSFVLDQPAGLSAKAIVEAARRLGLQLSEGHVYTIRSAAKQKGATAGAGTKGKAKAAPKTSKAAGSKKAPRRAVAKAPAPKGKAARAAAGKGAVKAAKRGRPVTAKVAVAKAGTASPAAVSELAALDLAYAVGRLVESGKTTAAEVLTLAVERGARISALELDLAALRGGQVPASEPSTPSAHAKRANSKVKAPQRKASGAKTAKAPGTVSTRSDGRTFTTTAKVVAARKLQGQYMGYLRQLPEKDKVHFKAVARNQGVPAAIAELKKKLGKA